jgi:hypothetical protein
MENIKKNPKIELDLLVSLILKDAVSAIRKKEEYENGK